MTLEENKFLKNKLTEAEEYILQIQNEMRDRETEGLVRSRADLGRLEEEVQVK